jgi:CheY-like chemotaxis protein
MCYRDDGVLFINYICIFRNIMMPGMDGYQVCKRSAANSAR